MTNEQKMKEAIQTVIKTMMDRIMHKVLVEDPFIKEDHKAEKPLYAALVPDEIFKGSHSTVICDVYAEDKRNNKKYVFELKAPLPNSDQTKVSKEKILKLYSMQPMQVDDAYYALPYNPYGKRSVYAWTFPARWFDMKNDDVVLIGDEFWEKTGGAGTYKAFISAVNEIGKDYKDRIYREFLGIEPPGDIEEGKLD